MNENGGEIKPSMTTDNEIILKSLDNAVTIPRNCLFSIEGETFIYTKADGKIVKKRVVPGMENDEMVVIESGLKEKDKVLTSVPEDAENIPFIEN